MHSIKYASKRLITNVFSKQQSVFVHKNRFNLLLNAAYWPYIISMRVVYLLIYQLFVPFHWRCLLYGFRTINIVL